ncbi:MAG: alpha-glucan family phosphorylase [Guyparkeria sp.]|uniref:alpha-glucan family phosphorylase n=1 Tax=Guyparkeria sp. TaxID=2035736 RepID=UPI003978F0BC
MPTTHLLEIRPTLPERLARLEDLAGNLYYSWSRPVRDLFDAIDTTTWNDCEGNPVRFLQLVPQSRLDAAAGDAAFLATFDAVVRAFDDYLSDPRPGALSDTIGADRTVAYFCAEFGFHESLPIYSGGLGILAADHCKAASDLGLPLVGMGLLYRQGYFQQWIDADGNQHARFEDLDFGHLPIHPVSTDAGPLKVSVELPGRSVWLQLWEARVGRVSVYLLDADQPENRPEDREITHRLYGGGRRTRIEQEILLGVGGVRALRALGIAPDAWHLNEGHAAFAILERVGELAEGGVPFDTALNTVAAGTLFTTHTPVPAGHDVFPPELVDEYWQAQLPRLGIGREQLHALGHDPAHDGGNFNMTALALRGSRQHNGVSRLHGQVAARLSQGFWPEVPAEENPITSVTNGVHVETFLNHDLTRLFDASREDWREHLHESGIARLVEQVAEDTLWSMHLSAKAHLLADIRARLTRQADRFGQSHVRLKQKCRVIDRPPEDILVIGFARRFATYKRADLLFADPDRLARIIEDSPRPVVFVFAGKAHPADEPGQALLREVSRLANEPRFRGHVLLLEGYDMGLARRLVGGCDIWLNTPEHPKEASGTSGQKAGMNGALNLSVADGWWAEGHSHGAGVANGWSIQPCSGCRERDREEAADLLDLLETEVIPLFDRRDARGVPVEWLGWLRHAIATIMPRFNAARMVRDYAVNHYRPAIDAGRRLAADDHRLSRELVDFRETLERHWGNVEARLLGDPPEALSSGDRLVLDVEVHSPGIDPAHLRCEVVLISGDGTPRVRIGERLNDAGEGGEVARHRVTLSEELSGEVRYRLRVVPTHEALVHPYEPGRMRWL